MPHIVAAQAAVAAAPTPPIKVDLERQEIRGPDGGCIAFEMDPFRKPCLLDEYEAKVQTARPWV